MMEIKFDPYLIVFIIIALGVLVFELIVTVGKPLAFGDEAYHAYIGKYIGTTHTFPKDLPGFGGLYTYSPLLHIILGVIYVLPSALWVLAKTVVPLTVLVIGMSMFILLSKLYNSRLAFVASVIIIALPIFVTYSVLIYTDMLMVLFFFLSFAFTLLADKFGSKKYWFLAVVFASLSYLSKTPGIVSFLFIGGLLVYKFAKKELSLKQFLAISLISIGIVAALVGWWWVRNYVDFKTIDCNLPLTFFNTVIGVKSECYNLSDVITKESADKFAGYVAPTGSNLDVLHFGLKGFMEFVYGKMLLVPLFVFCGIILMLRRRERNDIYLLVLLLLSVLPVIFVSSARVEDVGRYIILSTVTFALMSAVFLEEFFKSVQKFWKYIPVLIIIVMLILFWPVFKSRLDTMSQVKTFSPLFFDACDWIKGNTPNDGIFLSLWSAPTAYNCERTSKWSTNDLPDIVLSQNVTIVLDALESEKINYIFIQKFAMSGAAYITMVPYNFVVFLESNPNNFQKVYENGPSLNDCASAGGCDGTIVYKVIK